MTVKRQWTPEVFKEIAQKEIEGMTRKQIALQMGCTRKLLNQMIHQHGHGRSDKKQTRRQQRDSFDIAPIPDSTRSIDEIVEARVKFFTRAMVEQEALKEVEVKVKSSGAYALCLFGDPHLDNHGTDLMSFERDIQVIERNPSMYAINIGDVLDHWIGRLAKLHQHNDITAAESWKLLEHYTRRIRWLAIIGGNHDAWVGDGDPMRWIAKSAHSLYSMDDVRLKVVSPCGLSIKVWGRHEFPGHSMWNSTHGQRRAGLHQWRADVLVGGHKHNCALQMVPHPDGTGTYQLLVQLGAYKVYDEYAKALNFDQSANLHPSAAVVVRPNAPPVSRLSYWASLEDAADFVSFANGKRIRVRNAKAE